MANARSIIEKAARKIHVLGRGQTMAADEVNDALDMLNDMLGSLSADVDYIFNNVRETFSLTGATSYTIGTGGDFNTARPIEITALYLSVGGIDYPLKQIGPAEYADIGFKAIQGVSEAFYYENNTPLARLFFYPVATAGYTVTIYSLKALTEFADLTTDYDLPEGAVDMLVYNLAVRMAPDYEKEASDTVKRIAQQTRGNMAVYNKRHSYPVSEIDVGTSGANGNIFNGWFIR